MANVVKTEVKIGEAIFSFETGKMAKQASGAVFAKDGDTSVLATACVGSDPDEWQDFFPLSVHYREKSFAAGKIPGGFFKKEGRPGDKEVLVSRLIDRPIRPLFPEGFFNEVQVMVTVFSTDKINQHDILAINSASAALTISEIPFDGPLGAVRVGKKGDEFIVNPRFDQMEGSTLDLVVAGTDDAIMMIEGSSEFLTDEDMLEALKIAHTEIKKLVAAQVELAEKVNVKKIEPKILKIDEELNKKIRDYAYDKIKEAMNIINKHDRNTALNKISADVKDHFSDIDDDQKRYFSPIIHDIEKDVVRSKILDQHERVDGRKLDEIRPIEVEIDTLPKVHGSALFTRGETQSLGVVTLGTLKDAKRFDDIDGEGEKTFMLHYYFPPFSVGEISNRLNQGRREIGHGMLAERSIAPTIPGIDKFPYTIRSVSEILESNGSSSMATVCSGSMALMAAGVPVSDAVAGIAMGLIKQDDKYVILTDIQGLEDHLGDMDFKVAGTDTKITAFQMDIKVKGITFEIMEEALKQAAKARVHILNIMKKTIDKPRGDLSKNAPAIKSITVPVKSIGSIIGPGGKVIRDIQERTGSDINISDTGEVTIYNESIEKAEEAMNIIQQLTEDVERGKIYQGKVIKIMNFGAFIEILPGKEGLCHISKIENRHIKDVNEILSVGDIVPVKVLSIENGKISLSRKDALNELNAE